LAETRLPAYRAPDRDWLTGRFRATGEHVGSSYGPINQDVTFEQIKASRMAVLDFPPTPKLNIYGELDAAKSSPNERRGEALFTGKARCMACHSTPYYTDNSMHDLKAERFYKQEMANGMMMAHDGSIKTFPLRGIKDSPPYLHDGRCLTLEDTVEYFNLIQQLRLSPEEKTDLVAFMRCL
jgi:cytochrome c peroxidase